jgi:enoyl-CoA hydratase/carnithine racemase
MSSILYTTLSSGVKKITLNRPEKCNALSLELIAEFHIALKEAEKESKILFLEGSGGNFCSGLDLKEFSIASLEKMAELLLALAHFPHPVVALAEGATRAGGMGLLAACDLAYASSGATFGLPELKKGFAPALVGVLLSQLISERKFKELAFTGMEINAETALKIGLIQGVGFEAIPRLTESLLQVDSKAFSAYKAYINKQRNLPSAFQEALALQRFLIAPKR